MQQLGAGNGRDFVVGDVHGKYTELMQAMQAVEFNVTKDRLIAVGDLIDRGKENMQMLDLLWEPWFFSVVGNHEIMMCDALSGVAADMWFQNGGLWFCSLDSLSVQKLRDVYVPYILETMPMAIEFISPSGKRVGVTHADIPAGWSWDQLRKHLETRKSLDSVCLLWSRKTISAVSAPEVLGIDLVIHGHTPSLTPQWRGNTVFIDNACSGSLSLINVEDLCLHTF